MNAIPLILAGGSGTRLWPLSRKQYPKQFISFDDKESLFQKTLLRCGNETLYSDPVVVTNEDYRFLVAQQARDIGVKLGAILLEPAARNTAPALAAASHYCRLKAGGDVILHVMPSDHRMEFDKAMCEAVLISRKAAETGDLVTFGIGPSGPETGYGYIEAGAPRPDGGFDVRRFVEKPDAATASVFLEKGGFYWNSGMFVFSADTFLGEMKTFEPEIHALAGQCVEAACCDLDFTRLDAAPFEKMKSISVDYAVFERTKKCRVVPVATGWSDLGSFDAVRDILPRDEKGNSVKGRYLAIGAKNNLIVSGDKFVAVQGVDDLAIVVTDDAVLVNPLGQTQGVKAIVDALKASPDLESLADEHTLTYRPWGGYASILKRERFQIKRLFVRPGARLSLQKHRHRSEHWVVVSGTAEVTIDGAVLELGENQSTYIPLGAVHRLANPGRIVLEVIEVQIGSYLGEDDIIRIDDEFGRK